MSYESKNWNWWYYGCSSATKQRFIRGLFLSDQTDSVVSPSTQCTEAAYKARGLTFRITQSFLGLSIPACIPLYGALLRPHLEYGMPACLSNHESDINNLDRIQRLATWLVNCIRHLLYKEGLQRLGLFYEFGLTYLQHSRYSRAEWMWTRARFFSLPFDSALEGNPKR